MEETIGLILIIFWTIWIPWMTLWFGSVILSNMGHPQLNKFILNYLYYFSPLAKRQRQLKLENYIRQHGTEEEKLNLHNKLNPGYQIMTNDEVFKKYKDIDKDKVIITSIPNFNIDTRTNTLYDNKDDVEFIQRQLDTGISPTYIHFQSPRPKEYVKHLSVETYDKINTDIINQAERIFIFPHKTKHYRFATI